MRRHGNDIEARLDLGRMIETFNVNSVGVIERVSDLCNINAVIMKYLFAFGFIPGYLNLRLYI